MSRRQSVHKIKHRALNKIPVHQVKHCALGTTLCNLWSTKRTVRCVILELQYYMVCLLFMSAMYSVSNYRHDSLYKISIRLMGFPVSILPCILVLKINSVHNINFYKTCWNISQCTVSRAYSTDTQWTQFMDLDINKLNFIMTLTFKN